MRSRQPGDALRQLRRDTADLLNPARSASPAKCPDTQVKICGITRLADARYCAGAGADYLGFIQYPDSPR